LYDEKLNLAYTTDKNGMRWSDFSGILGLLMLFLSLFWWFECISRTECDWWKFS
jgi:hypothetical protein